MEAVNNPSAAGVTRVIHNDLQKELDKISGKEQPWQAVFEEHCKSQKLKFLSNSHHQGSVYTGPRSGLFEAVYNAYAHHLPLKLSPDNIWLAIMQGVAHHINANPEKLRNKLVDHEGKKQLVVRFGEFLNTPEQWTEAFGKFDQLINENVKTEVAGFLKPGFTTSTLMDLTINNIATMDTFQAFFEYIMLCGCGLPQVTLSGTLEDWTKLRTHAERMIMHVEMDWWAPHLLPILDEFIHFYTTGVNLKFWDCIYKPVPQSVSGRLFYSKLSHGSQAGWITSFYPYVKKGVSGRYGEKVEAPDVMTIKNENLRTLQQLYAIHDKFAGLLKHNETGTDVYSYIQELGHGVSTDSFPQGISTAPIKVVDMIAHREFMTHVWGGFYGFTIKKDVAQTDPSYGEVQPAIGWYVGEEIAK